MEIQVLGGGIQRVVLDLTEVLNTPIGTDSDKNDVVVCVSERIRTHN